MGAAEHKHPAKTVCCEGSIEMTIYLVCSVGRTTYYNSVEASSQKAAIEKVKKGVGIVGKSVETEPEYRQSYSAKKQ